MPKISYGEVLVAAVGAFALSSLYYSPLLMGNLWRSVDTIATSGMKPSIAKALAELARTLVITYVLSRILIIAGSVDWKTAIRLALWLWFGFSAMMWVGAIMWENTSWKIAAIHSGDWLVKTLFIAGVLGLWGSRKASAQSIRMGA